MNLSLYTHLLSVRFRRTKDPNSFFEISGEMMEVLRGCCPLEDLRRRQKGRFRAKKKED